jgi:hypothetical protein
MKFDHVAVPSSDIAQSVQWYQNKFGATVLYQDDSWAFLDLRGTKFALVSPQQHPPHIAIDVSEEELVKQSRETGTPMDTHRDGTIGLYIHDPFGNAVELIHYPPGKTSYVQQSDQTSRAALLAGKFTAAMTYERYVASGTTEQQRRWQQVYEAASLSEPQRQLLASFTREMKILAISGIWCGDCVQQVPLIQKIAEGNLGCIYFRILDRDEHRDLIEPLRINTGDRVPMLILMAEDFEPCAVFGDRTLARYRALARKQLGAACPTGLGPPDADELASTMRDWLDEIERVQWMLRLSARLRAKHGD